MNLENKKQIAVVLLAIGLGLVASVLTANYIKKSIETERKRVAQQIEKKSIDPLKKEIGRLRKEMKELASRPSAAPIQKETRAQKPTLPKSSLALRTPAGKRAYTVRIDGLSAVGGLINPGDYVDVLAQLKIPLAGKKKGKRDATLIIFQNIQILAVGANLKAVGGYAQQMKARALKVTFALTPEECSLMTFVQRNGKIQLVLRAPSETETEILQTANWSALADYVFEKQGTELVIPRAKAEIKPVSPQQKEQVKPFIEIYQGGRKK